MLIEISKEKMSKISYKRELKIKNHPLFWHDVFDSKPPKRISQKFLRERGYTNPENKVNKQNFLRDLNVQLQAHEREERKELRNEYQRDYQSRKRNVRKITENIFKNVKLHAKKEKSSDIIKNRWFKYKYNKVFDFHVESKKAFKHVDHLYFSFKKDMNLQTAETFFKEQDIGNNFKDAGFKDVDEYIDHLIHKYNLPQSMVMAKHNVKLMKRIYQTIIKKLQKNPISIAITATYLYRRPGVGGTNYIMYHKTPYEALLNHTDIDNILNKLYQMCDDAIDKKGDSKRFMGFVGFTLRTNTYKPINGGSYIELPKELKGPSRGLTNIQNIDNNRCFWLNLILFKLGGPENINHASDEKTYKKHWDKIKIPPSMNIEKGPCMHEWKTICNLNEMNMTIVHTSTKKPKDIYPLFVYKPNPNWKTLNLLLLKDNNTKNSHYIYIKDKPKFLGSFYTSHKEKVHICDHCHKHYHDENKYNDHIKLGCQNHGPAKLVLPKVREDGSQPEIKFSRYDRQIKKPFVIYADIEAYTTFSNIKSAQTEKCQHHEVAALAYCIIDEYKALYKERITYKTFNNTKDFMLSIIKDAAEIKHIMNESCNPESDKYVPIKMTKEDNIKHKNCKHCYMCHDKFDEDDKGLMKVRDHCHFTGKYRGAAHNKCNLRCRNDHCKLDVFFHNGKNYDFHFLMQSLSEVGKDIIKFDVKPIFINSEKQLSFSIKGKDDLDKEFEITFKDSFQFMAMSLEGLVENLKKSKYEFKCMNEVFGDKAEMLKQKGYLPYDWYNDPSKNKYTSLPPIEEFYSKLSKKHLTQDEYDHACKIWKEFKCVEFEEYMHVYLKTDVILLADVFEQFRTLNMDNYGLDPCHYFTSPGVSWESLLKMYGGSLDLLTDEDMILMFEKGMRGGISMISKRYAKANNTKMENYDKDVKSSYIIYQDMNNLYGGAMCMPLPIGDFRWEESTLFTSEMIKKMSWNQSRGYTFMVDLKYPNELHDLHNQYPLAPEKMTITPKMVSKYNHDLAKKAGEQIKSSEKLVPNLNDKKDYVVNYMALKQCLDLGLELEKVHKVISYNQKPWMKDYIMFNTNKRIEAKKSKNKFLEEYYKLQNNSVFGKTMENVRKRSNLQLFVNNEKLKVAFEDELDDEIDDKPINKKPCMSQERKLLRHLSDINILKDVIRYSEDMIAIEKAKTQVIMNKPIYCGQCILDISKTFMYDYHYNTMMKMYGHEKCQLLFTDTDSLCYHIETQNLYEDMKKIKDKLDTSNYPKDHTLYDEKNMCVLGKMKDETSGVPIVEFVGLKPKMYAYRTEKKEEKRAKGVKKVVVEEDIHFKEYKDVVFNKTSLIMEQSSIRSYRHQLYTINQMKNALNGIDTKKYILDDGINSLALGHYKIPQ